MLKKFITTALLLALMCSVPLEVESSQLCSRDYGGYVPAAGRAYENACCVPCFSPCLAVGFVALASLVTIVALNKSSGDTGVVIHAHSE